PGVPDVANLVIQHRRPAAILEGCCALENVPGHGVGAPPVGDFDERQAAGVAHLTEIRSIDIESAPHVTHHLRTGFRIGLEDIDAQITFGIVENAKLRDGYADL